MKRASNARELLFENPSSKQADRDADPGLQAGSALRRLGLKDAGRSATIHNLHLSRAAFWPHAAETMLSLMQAVPHDPQTMVIIESTANGVGGEFHQLWLQAVRGESNLFRYFSPGGSIRVSVGGCPRLEGRRERRTKEEEGWGGRLEHLGSRRMQPGGPAEETGRGGGRNKARIMLMPRNNGTMRNWLYRRIMVWAAQLRWRRWCISANCGGDPDRFIQEYPASADEAFLASGRPVFASRALAKAYAAAKEPMLRGELEWERSDRGEPQARLRQERRGRLAIYEQPSSLGLLDRR